MFLEDKDSLEFTYAPAVAGGRKVHALMGGGPGMLDAQGRPMFFKGMTWCGVEKRASVYLAETTQAVTCKTCLSQLRKRSRPVLKHKQGKNGKEFDRRCVL